MNGQKIAVLTPFVPVEDEGKKFSSHVGGVERYAVRLSMALRDQGWDVTIVYPGEGHGPPSIDGVALKAFPRGAVILRTPVYNPIRHLRALKGFDLVHTQATYPILSDMNSIFAKIMDMPSVVTYHFNPSPDSALGEVFGRVYGKTLAKLVSYHDRIIFSSSTYREITRTVPHSSDDRVRVVPMGVDTERFQPDASVPREKRFLFVGRLIPYKDIHLLLRSMRQVKKQLPDHELVIAGSGPLEHDLRRCASELNVNVRFLGRVSDDYLLHLYRSSLATVLPSHDSQEAFGMVLLESMSCGTRVIAADIPGVREVASVGGTVVEPNSESALADAMIGAAEMSASCSEMDELHNRVNDTYSWDSVATMTSRVYRELMDYEEP